MAFITDVLKRFFGTKSERDIKEIQPYVDKALLAYTRIDLLTNNELRSETLRIRNIVQERIAGDEERKKSLRARLDDVMIDVKENSVERLLHELTHYLGNLNC